MWGAWDGIKWQPLVEFTWVLEAWLLPWTWQIQKSLSSMLKALKPQGSSTAPMGTCLSCNYVGVEWEDSVTRIKQTQDRRGSTPTGHPQSMFDDSSSTQGLGVVEHIWFGGL